MHYPISRKMDILAWSTLILDLALFCIFLITKSWILNTFWPKIFAVFLVLIFVLIFIFTGFSVRTQRYENMLDRKKLLERKLGLSDDNLLKAISVRVCGGDDGVELDVKLLLIPQEIRRDLQKKLELITRDIDNYKITHGKFLLIYQRLVPKNA